MPITRFLINDKLNIDITKRCPLECLECMRQQDPQFKKRGEDMSLENFNKVLDHFNNINFCGQLSDPIHHPKFLEFLQLCKKKKKIISVHTASTFKPIEWYVEAFQTAPHARWWLSLDGRPEDSPIYRVNQDGYKMLEIIKLAGQHLIQKPIWQCIKFNYNENYIDELKVMADELNVIFLQLDSHRWSRSSWLKPKN